jgi:hypothetical protein
MQLVEADLIKKGYTLVSSSSRGLAPKEYQTASAASACFTQPLAKSIGVAFAQFPRKPVSDGPLSAA